MASAPDDRTPTAHAAARRPLRMVAWSALVALSALVLGPDPAAAHAVSIGQSKISDVGGVVRYELAVDYDELAQRVRLGLPATRRPGGRATTDAQRESALRRAKPRLQSYVGARVRVLADGTPCTDTLQAVDVIRFQGAVFAVLSSSYRCAGAVGGPYAVHYDLFFDALSADQRHTHANVADYRLGGATGRIVFEPGNQVLAADGAADAAGPEEATGPDRASGGSVSGDRDAGRDPRPTGRRARPASGRPPPRPATPIGRGRGPAASAGRALAARRR